MIFPLKSDVIGVFSLLLLAFLTAYVITPTEVVGILDEEVQLEDIIPREFGDWREFQGVKTVQPLEQNTLADKIYDQTVERIFVNENGTIIMLVIAFGRNQSDALQVHLPEVCYAANGYKVLLREKGWADATFVNSNQIPLVRLLTRNGDRSEPVSYWTRVGASIPRSTLERQWEKLLYGLSGRIPDGILVRVSSLAPADINSFVEHDKFIQELFTAVPTNFLPLFFGNLAAI